MMPLGLLGAGDYGEIVEIRGLKPAAVGEEREKSGLRIEELGLRVGKSIEMLRNGGGPILLKVDESRLALDRALAMKIMVKEVRI